MPGAVSAPQTLYDKVLRDHTVDEKDDGTILLYIGQQPSCCVLSGGIAQTNAYHQTVILSMK